MPPRELILTILPPPDFRISRAPLWQQKNTAFRLTEWMKSQSASVISSGIAAGEAGGVVHQPVKVAEAYLDFAEHPADFGDALQVGLEQRRVPALFGGLARVGLRVPVVNCNPGSFPRASKRNGAPDAFRRASDQDRFACEAHVWRADSPWSSSSIANAGAPGSGNRPVRWAQPQKIAVVELSAPAHAPITRGLQYCEAIPAASIESIMVDQIIDSMVAKTRPRNSFATCRRRYEKFSTELTATAEREIAMKNSAESERAHLAEHDISGSMNDVADHDGALISVEA